MTTRPPAKKKAANPDFATHFNLVMPWATFFVNVIILTASIYSNMPIERINILASLLNLGTGGALAYMRSDGGGRQ